MNIKTAGTFLLAVVLCAPSVSEASTWSYATTGSNGSNWFVDTDSVKNVTDGYNQTAKKAWVKIDYSEVKSEKARERKILYYFRCDAEQAKTVSATSYLADGSVMDSYAPSYPTYSPVVPESVLSSAMALVCAAN